MSDELKYYPKEENDIELYYVEFDRGSRKGEFTLFKRQYFRPWSEIEKIEDPNERAMAKMCNHCHPWNIFTSEYGQDGCVPDKAWVCWMVDCLNFNLRAAAIAGGKVVDGTEEKFAKIIGRTQ
jgi:hypothetical protein